MIEQDASHYADNERILPMSSGRRLLVQILLAPIGMGLGFSAFPQDIREEILERDGGCVVGSGCEGPLQASHIVHGENTAENGEARCVLHHYEWHAPGMEGENGLTTRNNRTARRSLLKKLREYRSQE